MGTLEEQGLPLILEMTGVTVLPLTWRTSSALRA